VGQSSLNGPRGPQNNKMQQPKLGKPSVAAHLGLGGPLRQEHHLSHRCTERF
jgi:hypothetical protein